MFERVARFMTPQRWRVYYLALGATLFVGVALPKALGPWDGLHDTFGTVIGGDYLAFYTGGRLVLEGRSAELYDIEHQAALQSELLAMDLPWSVAFVNPPPYALLMAPFAALPYVASVFVWWAVLALLFVVAFRLVQRELRRASEPLRTRSGLLFSIAFLPATLAIIMAQNTFLSLVLVSAAFVALRRGREGLAGVALGLMALKPQLALGFAVVLLVQRRWVAIGVALATGLAFVGASHVLMPGAWAGYLESVPETAALVRNQLPGNTFPAFYQTSVPTALALLVDPFSATLGATLVPAVAVAILVAVAFAWRGRAWAPGTRGWDLAMVAAAAAGWLASPHLLFYDVGLFLLPGWVAYAVLGTDDTGRPFGGERFYGLTVVALVVASLWIPLVSTWLWEHLPELGWPRVVPQLVTVALALWVVALHRRAGELDSLENRGSPVGFLMTNDPGLGAARTERSANQSVPEEAWPTM